MPVCESCGKKLPDNTNKVVDPFDEDIYGEINMKYLCDTCYEAACDDI